MKQIIVMAMIMYSHFVVHMKAGRHFGFILSMQISKQTETHWLVYKRRSNMLKLGINNAILRIIVTNYVPGNRQRTARVEDKSAALIIQIRENKRNLNIFHNCVVLPNRKQHFFWSIWNFNHKANLEKKFYTQPAD